jgi:hypothetical protein
MDRAGIKDIVSGLIFIGFGAAFGYAASGYQLGTAFRMGPGYFPLVLAGFLAVLGATIRGLGLVPALAGAAFLSALGSSQNGPLAAAVIAAALTVACVVIFHTGLGVAVPLFGPWLQ